MIRASRVCAAGALGVFAFASVGAGPGARAERTDGTDLALRRELEGIVARDPGDSDARRRLEALRALAGSSRPTESAATSRGAIGPDIIVGSIPAAIRTGKFVVSGEVISGYTVGTTSCNIGDENADWFGNTPAHPVIIQNLFRLKDGKFEQIGVSWAKHGFLVIPESLCQTCSSTMSALELIPGCADTYSTSTNSMTNRLGPRWQVNAVTSVNVGPAPPATSLPQQIRGMMQAKEPDVDPAQNVGARYFVEVAYVAADDTAAGNQWNNWSHREVSIAGSSATQNYLMSVAAGSITQVSRIGLEAWVDADPMVQLATSDVPGDGRFVLGTRVYDNGDGTWTYEYALYNQNSDRAGSSFSVPVGEAAPEAVGFHDVFYHSGDGIGGVNFDGADWASSVADGAISWACTAFNLNQNANALRFGTIYNFRFTTTRPPMPVVATVGLFKPGGEGSPVSFTLATLGPGEAPCPSDVSGDGLVNSVDLSTLLGFWNQPGPADLNGDGFTNSIDLALLLGAWGACP